MEDVISHSNGAECGHQGKSEAHVWLIEKTREETVVVEEEIDLMEEDGLINESAWRSSSYILDNYLLEVSIIAPSRNELIHGNLRRWKCKIQGGHFEIRACA